MKYSERIWVRKNASQKKLFSYKMLSIPINAIMMSQDKSRINVCLTKTLGSTLRSLPQEAQIITMVIPLAEKLIKIIRKMPTKLKHLVKCF